MKYVFPPLPCPWYVFCPRVLREEGDFFGWYPCCMLGSSIVINQTVRSASDRGSIHIH